MQRALNGLGEHKAARRADRELLEVLEQQAVVEHRPPSAPLTTVASMLHRARNADARVEGYANLGEEDLGIPPRERSQRGLANLCEEVAREETRLGVEPCKGEVVVLGLEVRLLLLGEEQREVRDDGCATGMTSSAPTPSNGSKLAPKAIPRTIRCALHDRVDLAFDAHADVIVEDAHLAAHRDRRASERDERRRDVALPQMHDHVGEADDGDGREVGLVLAVVQRELVERAAFTTVSANCPDLP